ncbi:MAG TPA: DinB family protein [Thermoanaerobaculia bacterium]|nr:DinB family protein [Thermoanaerobaculia bacterium]
MPTIAELLLPELEREAAGTRRALERVPEGRDEWKPHEKSMPLGYLAGLVAIMPSWVDSIVRQDELELSAPGEYGAGAPPTNRELLEMFDKAVAKAKDALASATDEHLTGSSWRLLLQGKVVYEETRYVAIRDSVFNHLAHHRGQLTVYLRLNEAPVPSLYGPSADEKWDGG